MTSNGRRGGVPTRWWQSNMVHVLGLVLLGAAVLLVSGCSLHPKPFQAAEVQDQMQSDIQEITNAQPDVTDGVGLYEAMARAIKFNRERRLKMMQSALARQQKELSAFDLLPELTANAGYTGRDNRSASVSESYETGDVSLEASVSQEKHRRTSDVTFTWSVLDFGLSYVRARQQSDRFLMAKEVERKTVQNIVRDVRQAWWRAHSAQRLLKRIAPLRERVERALESSRQIEAQRLDAPLKALTYQRSLLDMLRTLESLRCELSQAKPRLASLMGLPPNQDFQLQPPENKQVPAVDWDIEAMEQTALMLRPELMESRYQTRVSSSEARASLLGLMPDLNLNAGWNWDSNDYLVNNTWQSYGAQLGWNLFQLFKAPKAMDVAEAKETVAKERRLAMSMTVLMQVHLAKARFAQAKRQVDVAGDYLDVEGRILEQIRSAQQTASKGEQALIREELNHLVAQVRYDKAHADLQNSFGRILNTLGVDPVPASMEKASVTELAAALEQRFERWDKQSLQTIGGTAVVVPAAKSQETRALAGKEPENVAAKTGQTAPGDKTSAAAAQAGWTPVRNAAGRQE